MLPIPKAEIWPYASRKQKQKKTYMQIFWAPLSYKHALSSSPYFFLIKAHNWIQSPPYRRPTVLKIWLYGISFKNKKLSICSQHLVNRSTSSKYKCPQSLTSWLRPMTCQALCILYTFSHGTLTATLSSGYHHSQLQMRKLGVALKGFQV